MQLIRDLTFVEAPLIVQSKADVPGSSLAPNANNSSVATSNQPVASNSLFSSTPLPCRGITERRDFTTPSTPIGSGNKMLLRRSLHAPVLTNQPKVIWTVIWFGARNRMRSMELFIIYNS